jgi:hypothetical protein
MAHHPLAKDHEAAENRNEKNENDKEGFELKAGAFFE